MGEIISAHASPEGMIADSQTALENAKSRGGDIQSMAETFLGPTLTVLSSTQSQIEPLKAQVAALDRELDVLNDESDDLVKEESDIIWNKLGRPGSDPYLEVIFPGGTEVYTEGKLEEQPARMQILGDMLLHGAHPRLDAATAAASAQRIQTQAAVFQAKVDEARPLRSKLLLLESVRRGLARVARIRLVNLKRAFLAAGMSEADIHQIIPDRPSGRSKKKSPPPEGDKGGGG